MFDDILLETFTGILDDAVDEELDAIDDIMDGEFSLDMYINAHIIPNNLVDNESDNTNYEKFIDKKEDY